MSVSVWRLRGRANIEAARRGRRASAGPIWVRWSPDDVNASPQVGYAIGRRVGTAVVRNRLRRRLRAATAGLAGELVPGRYLIGASTEAAALPFDELIGHLRAALDRNGALRP